LSLYILFLIVGRSARTSFLFTVHFGERLPAGDAVAVPLGTTIGGNVRQLTRPFHSLGWINWKMDLDRIISFFGRMFEDRQNDQLRYGIRILRGPVSVCLLIVLTVHGPFDRIRHCDMFFFPKVPLYLDPFKVRAAFARYPKTMERITGS